MTNSSKLKFSLEKLTYGTTTVVDASTNASVHQTFVSDTFDGDTIKALGSGSQFDFSTSSQLTFTVSAMYDTSDTGLSA